MNIDFSKIKKVYIIGIKGSGVSAVAVILKRKGLEVIGSDTSEKFFTDKILKKEKIEYFESFDASHLKRKIDLVVYSTAYNEKNNREFKEAKKRGLKMLSYPQILALLFREKFGIAVCGTHGKTTTSALIAHTLKECGLDPSAVIGSQVDNWKSNALLGDGKHMVIEADEYQNKLALYDPLAVVLTSLDWDHPDFFKDFSVYKRVFVQFVKKIPRHGFLVYCADDPDVSEVAKEANCRKFSYGFSEGSDFKIKDFEFPLGGPRQSGYVESFKIYYQGKSLGTFELKLAGRYNAQNAVSAVALGRALGIGMGGIKKALSEFSGTARRFECLGQKNGALLVDDYGHHPEEVKAVLSSARKLYPRKNLIVVFHPHSFTRTEALLSEFAASFTDANEVIVLDIYGSAREKRGKVSSKDLVDLINKYDSGKAVYLSKIKDAVDYLKNKIGRDDIVLTLGAGNVWEVLKYLKK